MEALILAGGQGTRLRPLTHLTPKPLVPFMGEPYAHGLLRRLVEVGVTRATFLVGQSAEPFAPLVAAGPRLGLDVLVTAEEVPLDTAGAARRQAALLPPGDPVLVCNGDVLSDVDLGPAAAGAQGGAGDRDAPPHPRRGHHRLRRRGLRPRRPRAALRREATRRHRDREHDQRRHLRPAARGLRRVPG